MSLLTPYLFVNTSPFVLFSINEKDGNASLNMSWEGSLKNAIVNSSAFLICRTTVRNAVSDVYLLTLYC